MLVDKRILAGGGALLVAGMAVSAILGSNMPVGESGMTEEEILTLLEQQRDTHHSGGADQLRQTYFNFCFRYFQIMFKGI